MEKLKILGYIVILAIAIGAMKFLSYYEFNERKGKAAYELAWSEEFDSEKLDESIWSIQEGKGNETELQYYTGSNYKLSDGKLLLQVNYDSMHTSNYLSTYIKGIKPMDFDSGYLEISIKPIPLEGVQNRIYLKSSNGQVLNVVEHNGNPDTVSEYTMVTSSKGDFNFSQPFTININLGISPEYLTTQPSIQNDFFPQTMFIDYIKIYKQVDQKMLF